MTAPSAQIPRTPAAVFALLALLSPGRTGQGRGEEVSEEQVQATMLVRVMKFVDWPAREAPRELRICILGGERFQPFVQAAAKSEPWHGRPIQVAAINKVTEAGECHVAYVASASEREIQSLIERTGRAVLTVSGRDGFARRGGMMNFIREQGRVGLEVNPGAGERVGLRFSSKLLRLVRVVRSGGVH